MHAVGQDKSAFSISVSNFNHNSFSTLDDIRGTIGIACEEILDEAHRYCQVNFNFFSYNVLEGSENANRSWFIEVHFFDSAR